MNDSDINNNQNKDNDIANDSINAKFISSNCEFKKSATELLILGSNERGKLSSETSVVVVVVSCKTTHYLHFVYKRNLLLLLLSLVYCDILY